MAVKKRTAQEWWSLAFEGARIAYEQYDYERHGICPVPGLENESVLCIYIHGYHDVPASRDAEKAELREMMEAEGIKVLAFASYPLKGEEHAGFTHTMLVAAGEDRLEWFWDAFDEIEGRSIEGR
jgi:hypothetical protein